MKSRKSLQRGFATLAALLSLALFECKAQEPAAGPPVVEDPGTYTPYTDVAIEPVTNAPFEVPQFVRPSFPNRTFNIVDYGAISGGQVAVTEAIAKTVAAAKAAGGGRVLIPLGYWLTGPIQIVDADNIDLHVDAGATVVFSGDYKDYLPPVLTRWEGMDVMNYSPLVYFRNGTNVALTGEGTLIGQGWYWWPWKNDCMCTVTQASATDSPQFAGCLLSDKVTTCDCPVKPSIPSTISSATTYPASATLTSCQSDAYELYDMVQNDIPPEQRVMASLDDTRPEGVKGHLRPVFVEFHTCKNVLIEGVTVEYGPFWTLHPLYSENVIVRNVNVVTYAKSDTYSYIDKVTGQTATAKTANGDGCNPDSSRNVLIEDSYFNTSDDVVAIKSGLNEDGWRVNRPSENVIVRRIRSGNGHGGVTVGSEMSGSVRNVFAYNCVLGGETSLRIKTLPGRGGEIANIYYDTIGITASKLALEVTTNYQSGTVDPKYFTDETKKHLPSLTNLHYDNIWGTVAAGGAIYLEGVPANAALQTPAAPIANVVMNDFGISSAKYAWNWGDTSFLGRFPDKQKTNYWLPNNTDPNKQPKTCLDVCGLQMKNVSVNATGSVTYVTDASTDPDTTATEPGPSLSVTDGSFDCVLSNGTTCSQ